ncbi:hypothetical protein BsWGS_20692 [Bradybaena similaris]
MLGVGYCVPLLAIVGCTLAVPRIISSPDFITVYTGQAVMFRCQVYDLQNSLMSWRSVTHNFTIYNGSRLLAEDNKKRYSLIRVTGGQTYNLQILDVTKSDEGFYKCTIEGTDQQLTSQLRVLEWPNTPSSGGSSPKLTDTSTDITSTVSPGGISASATGTSIETSTRCYGCLDMPKELIIIKADGSTDVLLTWDMEQMAFDTRFTVFYKALSDEQYTVISDVATTYYLIRNLKPRTFYTAYVVAKTGDYIESPPSKQVQFVSGSNGAPNDKPDKITDSNDDNKLILEIGIGVTVAAVVLILMVLLIICIAFKGRIKQSISFANPDISNPKATFTGLQNSTIKA